MASLTHVTRAAVDAAITECRELGRTQFLAKHGYGDSTVYEIVDGRERFPSKAILGVAAGLTLDDFFGGVAQTVPTLHRLGFTVTRRGLVCPEVSLIALTRDNHGRLRQVSEDLQDVTYFRSGSNRPGEIRGLGEAGQDIGVAVCELNDNAMGELARLVGTDVQVFVDSGAFSEVDLVKQPCGMMTWEVVRPISDSDWQKRLATYELIGECLQDQVWLVAPDCVGHQQETLRRLRKYARFVRSANGRGARILVVMHKPHPIHDAGQELTQAEFYAQVEEILVGVSWTPSLPCKKAGTSVAEVGDFVQAVRPKHVHLLGLGVYNRKASAYAAAGRGDGSTSVSMDSNWITANVGRKGKIRTFTAAKDRARALLGTTAAFALAELALLLVFGENLKPWTTGELSLSA